MDRQDLDIARLAAAIVIAEGGRHSQGDRRAAYRRAQELYAALEDAEVTEVGLAMGMHGAWCSGTRSGGFHEWSRHLPEGGAVLAALGDPNLDETLARGVLEDDRREP
jgi:hypothetical protein